MAWLEDVASGRQPALPPLFRADTLDLGAGTPPPAAAPAGPDAGTAADPQIQKWITRLQALEKGLGTLDTGQEETIAPPNYLPPPDMPSPKAKKWARRFALIGDLAGLFAKNPAAREPSLVAGTNKASADQGALLRDIMQRNENERQQYETRLNAALEKRNADRRAIRQGAVSSMTSALFKDLNPSPFEEKLAALRASPWYGGLRPAQQQSIEEDMFRGYREGYPPAPTARVQEANFLTSDRFNRLPPDVQKRITDMFGRMGGTGGGARTPEEQTFYTKIYGQALMNGEDEMTASAMADSALDRFRQNFNPAAATGRQPVDWNGAYPALPGMLDMPGMTGGSAGIFDQENLARRVAGYQHLIERYPATREDARREFIGKYGVDPEAVLQANR